MNKVLKWIFILAPIVALVFLVTNMFSMHMNMNAATQFASQMPGGHHGMRGAGGGIGHMGGRGIHSSFTILPLLVALFLMIVGYVMYKIFNKKRATVEELISVQDLGVPTYTNRDFLDEWENQVRKEEKNNGDF